MSKWTAPGMCPRSYTLRPVWLPGVHDGNQLASIIRMSGAEILDFSQAAETSGDDIALYLHPWRDRQILRAEELRIEELGLIAVAVIAKYRHDRVTRPEILCEADRSGNVDA